ncbi:toll-like receptor 4 [Pecten maximus]|uniref:toll-like receptor 4 n=1 Tax=Pecten maximus TaxID=6579 RepID=UPI001457EC58|nr:toll-like receptor 4 [Pecten maximus]
MDILVKLLLSGLQIASLGLLSGIQSGYSSFNNCTSEPKCRCFVLPDVTSGGYDGGLGADCSREGLSSIPIFSPDVTWISLSHNLISTFPGTSEIGYNVTFLDLSNNKIGSFKADTLHKLRRLISLDLSYNDLRYNDSIFKPGQFKSLKKLQYLNLKGNANKYDNGYPQSIGELESLTTLQLDGIDGANFPLRYQTMSNLTTLDLSSLTGNCKVKSLTRRMFDGVSVIRYLNVSYCKLTHIETGALGVLTQLRYLNLSHNVYLSFNALSNITFDLQFTDIRTLDISKVHCTYGVGTYVLVDDIRHLNKTKLEKLYVESNRLSMLQSDAFNYFPPTLRYISIRDNLFTMGIYVLQFGILCGLRELDLANSFTTHDPSDTTNRFSSCGDWRGPMKNAIATSPIDKEGMLPLDRLGNTGKGMTFIVNLPRNLEKISFANCLYRYVIYTLHFAENKLTHLSAQKNMFVEWRGPIFNLTKLEYADLSNNFCSYVAVDFFQHLTSLKTLIISTNLLGFMINLDTQGKTFQSNTLMTKLDISRNRIDMLPGKIFHTLDKMQYLNVSFNLMTSWDVNISHMTNLKYLDLSHNQLSELSDQNRRHIDTITKTGNLTINLSNNRLQCSCQTLPFMRWVNLNKKVFKRFHTYKCSFDNHTSVSFSDLDTVLQQLEKDCTSYIGLIAGLLSAIVFCLAILVCGLLFRYRWKLRYLYYLTKNRYRGYARIRDDQSHDYQYDAFVSYAEEESQFVHRDFIENLETNRHFRLCVHGRDFIPGMDIAANITNAIHSSRKTVIVMSENFVESYWCMYELNMARMESIYSREGASVLFLVMYSPVPARAIPLQVMDIIQSKSYIEYPDDPQGNVVFWDKIAEAIAI